MDDGHEYRVTPLIVTRARGSITAFPFDKGADFIGVTDVFLELGWPDWYTAVDELHIRIGGYWHLITCGYVAALEMHLFRMHPSPGPLFWN